MFQGTYRGSPGLLDTCANGRARKPAGRKYQPPLYGPHSQLDTARTDFFWGYALRQAQAPCPCGIIFWTGPMHAKPHAACGPIPLLAKRADISGRQFACTALSRAAKSPPSMPCRASPCHPDTPKCHFSRAGGFPKAPAPAPPACSPLAGAFSARFPACVWCSAGH
jgi:hypothetical protein